MIFNKLADVSVFYHHNIIRLFSGKNRWILYKKLPRIIFFVTRNTWVIWSHFFHIDDVLLVASSALWWRSREIVIRFPLGYEKLCRYSCHVSSLIVWGRYLAWSKRRKLEWPSVIEGWRAEPLDHRINVTPDRINNVIRSPTKALGKDLKPDAGQQMSHCQRSSLYRYYIKRVLTSWYW